ncbi:hypothetical protein [Pelagicoccus mobilis]|uniref:Uncharacterized protein n=1 Tax=Pelagicoccus mobilis TaxID=415221 RepID=A0A934VK19_9BACT|nr:hypothetical protein [Pelagicoccus mobilis]MBK1876201.1 hypothetical protein [Pelagicoccus mobilis]
MKLVQKLPLLLAAALSPLYGESEHAAPAIHAEQVDSQPTSGTMVTVIIHEKDGQHYAYSGGQDAELDSFKVAKDGKLTPLKSYSLWNEKGPARGLVTSTIAGTDYLFVGNKFGNAIEVHRIQNDGTLERVHVEHDTDETHLGVIITLQVIHMKDQAYLFAGGLEKTPGLTSYRINNDGSLTHVQSMADTEDIFTDGIIGMGIHKIEGKTYLFTGGFQDSGVSGFQVFDDGHFLNTSNVGDDLTRYLNGTYPLSTVQLGDNHYVVAGHRHHSYYKRSQFIKRKGFVHHGDGVSVFKVDQYGKLIPHSVLTYNPDVKIKGQTRIEIQKIDETQAVVAIATRDEQTIQICTLNAEGVLTPSTTYESNFPVYNGMTSTQIDGNIFLFAGSRDHSFLQSIQLEME